VERKETLAPAGDRSELVVSIWELAVRITGPEKEINWADVVISPPTEIDPVNPVLV
jgi:hypothetical protein